MTQTLKERPTGGYYHDLSESSWTTPCSPLSENWEWVGQIGRRTFFQAETPGLSWHWPRALGYIRRFRIDSTTDAASAHAPKWRVPRFVVGDLHEHDTVVVSETNGRRLLQIVVWPARTASEHADELWGRTHVDDSSSARGELHGEEHADIAEELRRAAPANANRAVAAFDELRHWLNLSIPDASKLIGTSKSAPMYWRRANGSPRPGLARNLYRLHALVRAVRDAVAPDEPIVALTRSIGDDGRSAYDLLLEGRYEDAERLLRPLIFPRDEQTVQRPRLVVRDDDQAVAPSAPLDLAPPVRRARRVTLPT